jgi:hypothetical protein
LYRPHREQAHSCSRCTQNKGESEPARDLAVVIAANPAYLTAARTTDNSGACTRRWLKYRVQLTRKNEAKFTTSPR